MKTENIRVFLGAEAARRLSGVAEFERVSEIRLRADKPLILRLGGRDYGVAAQSGAKGSPLVAVGAQAYRPTMDDIRETMEKISQYSFYAFESELSLGYITLPGGHRVGVAGQAVLENQVVRAWRYISGINIRVAHCVKGCADAALPFIWGDDGFKHTMIISPPGFGKTTLLRDIIRQISDGTRHRGLTVGLADERSEVAGCFRGVAQNDVGIRTDVVDGCPKALAMEMLLRAMSPDVIAADELGGDRDARAARAVLNAGVKLLCTAHGNDVADAMTNPALSPMLGLGIFERFIVLDRPGKVSVFDAEGKKCF